MDETLTYLIICLVIDAMIVREFIREVRQDGRLYPSTDLILLGVAFAWMTGAVAEKVLP